MTPNELRLELLWSLWAELGVPGWTRRHQAWWIDPEALLIATAAWADLDARLREEVLEWVVLHAHLLSAGRFKTLLRASPRLTSALERPHAAELLGDVRAHTQLRLPGDAPGRTRPLRRRGTRLVLDRPAQISLRLRALFGVGVRAEVVRALLLGDPSGVTATELVDGGLGFTKRASMLVLEDLQLAGALHGRMRGNTRVYRLADPSPLRQLVDVGPLTSPRWTPTFELLDAAREIQVPRDSTGVLRDSSRAGKLEATVRNEPRHEEVDVLRIRTQARELDASAELAELPGPPHAVRGEEFLEALASWHTNLLQELSGGHLPGRQR